MFKSKDEPLIQFVSTVPGLASIEDCLPKPAHKALPDWWTKTPTVKSSVSLDGQVVGNIKTCPALPDYFSQGYIIPMWTDSILRYDSKHNRYEWRVSDSSFSWDIHGGEQLLNHVPFTYLQKKALFVFKAVCPWRVITPKGYSVYQLPLTYHFNNEFSVFPGVIDTDVHHEINQQVMILKDKEEIFIKRGTPLAQYIPYKREKQKIEIRDANDNDKKIFTNYSRLFSTKFPGGNQYNLARKQGDK